MNDSLHWILCSVQFSSVQSFTHVRLFATLWTAAFQASLSITNSRSLLKLMSIESVMPSNHLILCRPLLLPPQSFPASVSQSDYVRDPALLCQPSVQFSCSVVTDSLWPHESQHTRPPCPLPTPGVYSNSCPCSRCAIQPSHPLSSPFPPAPNPYQHQSLFQWVNSSYEVAKVLEFQL